VQHRACPQSFAIGRSSARLLFAHQQAGTEHAQSYAGACLVLGGASFGARCNATTLVDTLQAEVHPVTLELLPRAGSDNSGNGGSSGSGSDARTAHGETRAGEAGADQPGALVARLAACSSDGAADLLSQSGSAEDGTSAVTEPSAFIAAHCTPTELMQDIAGPVKLLAFATLPRTDAHMSAESSSEMSGDKAAAHMRPQSLHVSCVPAICSLNAALVPAVANAAQRVASQLQPWLSKAAAGEPHPGEHDAAASRSSSPRSSQRSDAAGGPQQGSAGRSGCAEGDKAPVAMSCSVPMLAVAAWQGQPGPRSSQAAVLCLTAHAAAEVTASDAAARLTLAEAALVTGQVSWQSPNAAPGSLAPRFQGLQPLISAAHVDSHCRLAADVPLAEAHASAAVSLGDVSARVSAQQLQALLSLHAALQGSVQGNPASGSRQQGASSASQRSSAGSTAAQAGPAAIVLAVHQAMTRLQAGAAALGGFRGSVDVRHVAVTLEQHVSAQLAAQVASSGDSRLGRGTVVVPVAELRLADASAPAALQCAFGADTAEVSARLVLSLRVFNAACQAWDIVLPSWHTAARADFALLLPAPPSAGRGVASSQFCSILPALDSADAAATAGGAPRAVPRLSFECGNALDFTVTETVFKAVTAVRALVDNAQAPAGSTPQLAAASAAEGAAQQAWPPVPPPPPRVLAHPCATGDVLDCPIVFRNTCGLPACAEVSLLPAWGAAVPALAEVPHIAASSDEVTSPSAAKAHRSSRGAAGVELDACAEPVACRLRDACLPSMLHRDALGGSEPFSWARTDLSRCGLRIVVSRDAASVRGSVGCTLGPLPLFPLLAERSCSTSVELVASGGARSRIRLMATAAVARSGCIEVTVHTGVSIKNTLRRLVRVRGKGGETAQDWDARQEQQGGRAALTLHGHHQEDLVVHPGDVVRAPGWLVATGGFVVQPIGKCAAEPHVYTTTAQMHAGHRSMYLLSNSNPHVRPFQHSGDQVC
jgi:hypothetical protein